MASKPIASTAPDPEPVPAPTKAPKSIASSRFDEPIFTNRAKNVYMENIKGTKVLWYTTEKGEEIGRIAIKKRNVLEKSDLTVGFDYSIAANTAELLKITDQSYSSTQYHIKDGAVRSVVSLAQFTKEI